MARVTLTQNAFTSGELSPRVMGRTDMDRYLQGLKRARNGHPVIHGGFKRRAGSVYVAAAFTNNSNRSMLVPFVEGQGKAWMLEFANNRIRIYNTDRTYTGIELVSPYAYTQLPLLDWAQSDSTLWLVHPDVAPQRLQRLADDVWVIAPAPFTTEPFDEVGRMPSVSLTLSAATVGTGRTATAGGAVFLPSYVGRAIIHEAGIAVITAYTSATVATVEITRAFPLTVIPSGQWNLEGSPQIGCFTTIAGPVGAATAVYGAATRAASLSLSDVTGTVTATASASVFTAGDVGKLLFAGTGALEITTFGSGTSVTGTVQKLFDEKKYAQEQWAVQADAFRSADIGSFVRINGGLIKITGLADPSAVAGEVIRELAGAALAPALSWSLEPTVWGGSYGYPRSVTIHQQRAIFGGNYKFPRTVWGSRIGEPLDFGRWTDDDDAFAFTIDGDEATAIKYVTANKQLSILTDSGEYSMRSGVEKPITPTNVRVVPESNHGAAQVRPVQVNDEQMFVQRAGRKVRAFGYRYDFDAYRSPDISALAEHITASGVTWLAFAQEPEQMLWATRGDGKFLSCTIDRDQQPSVIGWARHETNGFVECVQTIPGTDRDQVWMIVRRTVNGAPVRYIEVLDDTFEPWHPSVPLPEGLEQRPVYGCTVDCAAWFDNAGGQTAFSVPHLAGCVVDIVADGSKMQRQTVAADGSLTIERPGKRVLIGMPFRTEATLLTPEVQTGMGSAQGQAARTGEMFLRFLDTIGATVANNAGGSQEVPFKSFGPDVLDNAPIPFTGLLRITMLGWERGESEITITQDDPMPMHLLAAVRTHQIGGG